MMPGSGMMGWGWGGIGMGIGWVFMLLFWGLIIVAVVLVVRWLWNQGWPALRGEGGGSALEILKQRYARGEIDREEFDAKKRDLVAWTDEALRECAGPDTKR